MTLNRTVETADAGTETLSKQQLRARPHHRCTRSHRVLTGHVQVQPVEHLYEARAGNAKCFGTMTSAVSVLSAKSGLGVSEVANQNMIRPQTAFFSATQHKF